MINKKTIDVAAAVIHHDNKYLCVQRPESELSYISKKYEFPGGKIESGESVNDALIREINEELRMSIKPIKMLTIVKHEYPDFIINLYAILCSVNNNELTLTEHIDYKWLAKESLKHLDWAAADIPIVTLLTE